jgi:hypothetical protein
MPSNQEPTSKFTLDRWLKFFRPQIREFADRAYQERAWFNIGPEVSSPIEMVCLLDKFGEDAHDPSYDLSSEQRTACARFGDMVHGYAHTHKGHLNEHEVIDDPEWEKIRIAAAELLKILPS